MASVRRLIGAAAVFVLLILGGFRSTAQAPAAVGCPPRPAETTHRISRPRWLATAVLTEYYPVREEWFDGEAGRTPGLTAKHRLDWLYGPHGVAMNGEGLGRDGRFYHFDGPYDVGWVNRAGRATSGCWNGSWTNGEPAWLDFGWRNRAGQVTYPLAAGGWSNRVARRYLPAPATLRFAAGRSRRLPFWRTVAVDSKVVPLGSRVFIPAYCDTPAHGWFRALDTGGAIIGYHFDIYRTPPKMLTLRALRGQHVYVLPPGTRLPRHAGTRCL